MTARVAPILAEFDHCDAFPFRLGEARSPLRAAQTVENPIRSSAVTNR